MSTTMAPLADTGFSAHAWVWGPAGRDIQLARAISDLTTGGYLGSTRELLAAVREHYDRRAYCTSVLAAVLARRRPELADEWLKEEPDNPDALLLAARVLVVRAIHAARARKDRGAGLANLAVRACQNAVVAAVGDPTPWVAMLHLGESRIELPELSCSAMSLAGDLEIYAPWSLLDGVVGRGAGHREAFHRLIPLCHTRHVASPWTPETVEAEDHTVDDARARAQVAVWAADQAAPGSPLKLLRLMHSADSDPLPNAAEEMRFKYFLAENSGLDHEAYCKRRREVVDERWQLALRSGAVKLAHAWFDEGRNPPYMPLSDVSFLAYYLYRQRERDAARLVLEWMIPYATAEPWRRDGDPGRVLARVCLECNVHPARLPR